MNHKTASATLVSLILFGASWSVFAQQAGSPHGGHHAPAQTRHAQGQTHHAPGPMPYAGFQKRDIKALSAQQIEDLRAGRGMSQALAAELNGYPGPLHTLELSRQLGLTAEQRAQVEALFSSMQAQAKALGEALIAAEQELDALFQSRRITPSALESQTQKIANLQGRLRAVHLGTHLEMVQVLTAEQVSAYGRLRGY